jgi:uroporphyrin-III C-methyltransferase/precorrin-2 dehydrogenase/sirohydrochlorin ferrochelatase/precorrin-2 dehydrogenase/sirohydrochlorin ferrochelatase
MKLFPVMLNLKGRSVLVIGGGVVALRKVEILSEFEADITVVSEMFIEEFNRFDVEKIKLKINESKDLEPLMAGRILVIVATNDRKLNELSEQLCNKYNILCNRVDVRDSSAIFAATLKNRDVIVSVSSSGTIPSFSVFLRDRIAEQIETYMPALDILKKVREATSIRNYEARKKLFNEILNNEEFWHYIEAGNLQNAETIAKKIGGVE